MRPSRFSHHPRRGSTLGVAIILLLASCLIVYSIMDVATADYKADRQQELRLTAKYAAESVLEYGAAQAAQLITNGGSLAASIDFTSLSLPPSDVFQNTDVYTGIDDTVAPTLQIKCYYDHANQFVTIDGSSVVNENDTAKGKKVYASNLVMVARASARDPGTGRVFTSYAYQQIQARAVGLFGYGIFYNPAMEQGAGDEFAVYGPVHSNRDMIMDPYQDSSLFKFYGRVSTSGKFQLGDPNRSGFTDWSSMASRMKIMPFGSTGDVNLLSFKDVWNNAPTTATSTGEFVMDNIANFRTTTNTKWKGNFETNSELVPLPGMDDYEEAASGANDSHKLIEPPTTASSIDSLTNATEKSAALTVEAQKFANLAGLVLEVDYSTGTVKAKKYVEGSDATSVYRMDSTTGEMKKYKLQEFTLPSGIVTLQTNVGDSGSNTFFDARRNRYVKMANIDVSKLKTAIEAGTGMPSTYNLNSDWNGVVYVYAKQTPKDSANYPGSTSATGPSGTGSSWGTGVRLLNGSQIPSRGSAKGMTVATNTALYVQGHYNADGSVPSSLVDVRNGDTNDWDGGTEANAKPAALVGDAVTVLSPAWSDSKSKGYLSSSHYSGQSLYRNNATVTEISAAILTGITPTGNFAGTRSGGANNLVRMLENWSSGKLAIRGSNVVLFRSEVADAPWLPAGGASAAYLTGGPSFKSSDKIGVFNGGPRWWVFSKMFEQGILPPGTPMGRTFRRTTYREVSADYFNSFSASTAPSDPAFVDTPGRAL